MKKTLPLLFLLLALVAFSQTKPSEPQLTEKDIDLFLTSYKPIVKDLYKLGKDYQGISDPSSIDALMANSSVQSIFKKYGWSDQQIQKFSYMTSIFVHQKYSEQLAAIPEEQKQMMLQAMPDLARYVNPDAFHPKDLELVAEYEDQIEEVFTEIENAYK